MKLRKAVLRGMRFLPVIILMLLLSSHVAAQTAGIAINQENQTIRGFGGMNHVHFIDPLTNAQVDLAFGNGTGQLGLTIMRIDIPWDSEDWNDEIANAQRAVSHGAILFASPWSPPAAMKDNGQIIHGSLRSDQFDDYANYLRDFANFMASNGVPLFALSIQNEPDFLPMNPEYDSCEWTPQQMRTFLDNNASVIPVNVVGPETIGPKDNWQSTLASAPQLDIYADHLYDGGPKNYPGKEHWMTEHFTNNSGANQWPLALGVGAEVNQTMANDYSAYIWWYIRRSYGLIDDNTNVTKRGYVMSQFSKFIRPGYIRVDAEFTPTSNVSVTAYKGDGNLVIVAVNQNSSSRNVTFNLSGGQVSSFTKYQTSSNNNVSNVGTITAGTSFTNSLAANSIATFVGTLGTGGGGNEHVWLEAECGTVGSLWNTNSDGSASNGQYVTIQSGNNSTGSAPTNTNGHINLPFTVEEGGSYTVWARVIAPTGNDDSFWIRMDGGSWINWNNIAPGSTSWTWDDIQSFSLNPGDHTLTVAYREDGTQLDKIYITNTNNTPTGGGSPATNCSGGGGDDNVWLEAECGNVGSLWNTNSDGSASNSAYVTIQSGNNSTGSAPTNTNGHITYNFNVTANDSYVLWARVIAPTPNDDSFWIRMDGGSWINWNSIAPGSTSWTWDDVQSFNLSPGGHTLTVAYREDGTQLDKLYITNSGNTPNGQGGAATGCGSGGGTIVVRALGISGNESIELRINDNTVQTWNLSTSFQNFTHNTSTSSGNIKVFFNDSGGENFDVQVDFIQTNGVTLQAEDQATNTGVWQNSACGGSFSEFIHCEGYIDFGTVAIGKQAVENATTETTPGDFALSQNYPNPFNPETEISYRLKEAGKVQLEIFNILGEKIKTLVDDSQTTGTHTARWNARDESGRPVSSGIYIYTLRVVTATGTLTESRKMVLQK